MQFLQKLLGLDKNPAPEPSPPPPPPPEPPPIEYKFRVGWATDTGMVRDHNEDALLVISTAQDGDNPDSAFGLFILADGMGGHKAGEVASALTARTVAHQIVQQFYLPSLVTDERDAGQPALNEILINAVKAANKAVMDQVPGGGTTLTCALIIGLQAYIAHVGDSRAYVVTEGAVEQITHDHSLVDRLMELGRLTPDEAAVHPQKNVLYRAVGQSNAMKADTYVRKILPGERLLLCSDGLWDRVSNDEMLDIVTQASSLQDACDELTAAANQAGGHDNITVILIEPPIGNRSPDAS